MKQLLKKIYPFRKKGRFYNYEQEVPSGFFLHSAYMLIKSLLNRDKCIPKDKNAWVNQQVILPNSVVPQITWIGHSTFLIQIGGYNILTDPIFGNATCLFPRILPPGISLDALPPIDFLLISHNHPDHMDSASLMPLKKHAGLNCLVPMGDKAWFDRRGFAATRECMWWDELTFGLEGPNGPITFAFLPAKHWSQRGIFDKNRSLWGSWMISWNGFSIYFGGDTGYSSHFKAIGQFYPTIDVAIMPIGPCEPRVWMKQSHVSAQEAGQGFIDLDARHFVPMHWATFCFGTDSFDMPLKRLHNWWQEFKQQLKNKELHVFKVGQRMPFEVPVPVVDVPEKPIEVSR